MTVDFYTLSVFMGKADFSQILKGKVVFLGIGNPLKGDDGIGPTLIQRLQGQVRATCIDAGTSPESYSGKVIREAPDTIVLVDAVHLGAPSGEWELLCKGDILQAGFTTHNLSPAILIQYLEKQTAAEIYLLGVQPGTVAYGEEMSGPVSLALDKLVMMIKEVLRA